jgi:hypothetical protein
VFFVAQRAAHLVDLPGQCAVLLEGGAAHAEAGGMGFDARAGVGKTLPQDAQQVRVQARRRGSCREFDRE